MQQVTQSFTPVEVPYGQPAFQFFHRQKEFLIYAWQEDADDDSIYSCCLAEPQLQGDVYKPFNLISDITDNSEEADMRTYIKETFMPRVNEYLANYNVPSDGYPEDAKSIEQFAWVVNNAMWYDETTEQIVLDDF